MRPLNYRVCMCFLVLFVVRSLPSQAQAIGATLGADSEYRLLTDVTLFKRLNSEQTNGDKNLYIALKGSRFHKIAQDRKYLHVRFIAVRAPGDLFPTSKKPTSRYRDYYPTKRKPLWMQQEATQGSNENYVNTDEEFILDTTDPTLPISWNSQTYGSEWGALVAPFKLSLKDWGLSASSVSLAPYYGWGFDTPGGHLLLPISLGLALGTSSSSTSGTQTSASGASAGLTIATGLIFQPGNNFQLGILTGADYYGSNGPVGQTNRVNFWLCFQIGTSFTSGSSSK